jgi:hypothetical protein
LRGPPRQWTPATGVLDSGTRACRLRPTLASWKRPRSFEAERASTSSREPERINHELGSRRRQRHPHQPWLRPWNRPRHRRLAADPTRSRSAPGAASAPPIGDAPPWVSAAAQRHARRGKIELQIPKIRQGSYFPSVLQARKRLSRPPLTVVQQAYVPRLAAPRRSAGREPRAAQLTFAAPRRAAASYSEGGSRTRCSAWTVCPSASNSGSATHAPAERPSRTPLRGPRRKVAKTRPTVRCRANSPRRTTSGPRLSRGRRRRVRCGCRSRFGTLGAAISGRRGQ